MNDTERTGYIAAITKLLEKADLRKLRLIWVYAKRPVRTPAAHTWPCAAVSSNPV